MAHGRQNHRWNPDALAQHSKGYTLVRVGHDHPLANKSGFAYLHDLVLASAGIPKAGAQVHHRNGDKRDNRLDNLGLMGVREHARLHVVERERDGNGRFRPGRED